MSNCYKNIIKHFAQKIIEQLEPIKQGDEDFYIGKKELEHLKKGESPFYHEQINNKMTETDSKRAKRCASIFDWLKFDLTGDNKVRFSCSTEDIIMSGPHKFDGDMTLSAKESLVKPDMDAIKWLCDHFFAGF